MLTEKLKQYWLLMRFHKPIGILLLLWPTLWGLWLAGNGKPNNAIVLIFLVGVILMRAAGCIINDIADRNFDKYVERTKERPLTSGKIKIYEALLLFFCLLLAAFLLVLTLNRLTIELAFIGAALAIIYPFLKRITHLPQFGLGLAFAWGVPMAFAAVLNAVPLSAWELFFAAVLWPVIYDTMYAMVDRADDKKIGVKSTAILFAKHNQLIIGILQILFISIMLHVGYVFHLTVWYYLSLVIAALLFIYQQILIKDNIREKCFKAFLNNNWVGLCIFIGIILT